MNHTSSRAERVLAASAPFVFFVTAILLCNTVFAQVGDGRLGRRLLQQKLAAIKASAAENQHQLRQYTWTEISHITINGRALPPKESTCSYGVDGKVHKIPVGGAARAESGNGRRGRFGLKQRIIEKKTADMKAYMHQVARVLALYVPPDPHKMQQAFRAGKVSFDRAGGMAGLVFRNYALPGDAMTIGFNAAAGKIRSLDVNSHLDSADDTVMLKVEFASLADGTNHPSRTTLDAPAKGVHVVNTNTNYRKIGQ
jgi:hypothetical protein